MKASLVLVFLISAVSCAGGTETGNPATLKNFESSACKTRETDTGQQALVLASDAEGLQCVEWDTDASGTLSIKLLNFPEPCGDAYLGAASHDETGLSLSVYKDTCALFKCGWCVFDFDFTLAGLDLTHDLPVRIGSAVCASEPTTYGDELTLPLAKQTSGSVCRYLERSPLEWYGRARGSCGQRNMPCGDCSGTDMLSCGAGLRCTELAAGDSRCLAECTTDDDCAGGLTTCQDGVCQAPSEW
jgi:hypothetical protein